MTKRLLSFFLALMLALSLGINVSAVELCYTAAEIDGLRYRLYDSYAMVSGYTGTPVDVVIPAQVQGLPVTEISDEAFEDCASLRTVQIPNSVTTIGYSSFRWSGLAEVSIPASVTELGSSAFEECLNLTAIEVDEANPTYWSVDGVLYGYVQYFGDYHNILMQIPGKFSGVLTVQEGTYSIAENAVRGCSGITQVNLPASLAKFRSNYFSDCPSLTAIYVDDANEQFYDIDGIMYGSVITYDDEDNEIEQSGLIACPAAYSASEFTVPEGVEIIGSFAFQNCANIVNLYIPASTVSIYTQNFIGCDSLTGIWVADDNPTFISDDCGVVYNRECTYTEYVYDEATDTVEWVEVVYPDMSILHFLPTGMTGCYEIPEGVVRLAYDSAYCANITALIFPTTLTRIIDYALGNCENLEWMLFRGNLPQGGYSILNRVTATIYYPSDNSTWADLSEVEYTFDSYLANLTYVGYAPGNEPSPPCEMITPPSRNPFTDVPAGSFYEEPVLWALENGITTGATDITFDPDGQCLRAQVVTFLHRAAKNPAPTSTKNPFTDVKTGDFFYNPVLWAVEKGITNGVSADRFGSYDVCNRAAVVTFLWRAAGSPEPASTNNPFTDVKTGDFFYKPVLWAVENGITNGLSATEFGPTANCNRAQVVTFLYRAYN